MSHQVLLFLGKDLSVMAHGLDTIDEPCRYPFPFAVIPNLGIQLRNESTFTMEGRDGFFTDDRTGSKNLR